MALLDSIPSERTRCAFCRKPFPTINGRVTPWRAATGELFCNEFCADDAEEARFQRRGRTDRGSPSDLRRM